VRRILRTRKVPVDQLDPVAVGVGDEANAPDLLTASWRIRGLLGVDAVLGETAEQVIQIINDQRQVVVAVTQVIGLLAADVDGQLEYVAATREAEVDVVRGVEVQGTNPDVRWM
jgi:hypothetical protein